MYRPLVELVKIVGGVIFTIPPVVSQPTDVLLLRFYVLGFLLGRVRIVEPQVAQAVKILCNAKLDANAFGVSDVKVAIGLWWESGVHAVVSAALQVLSNSLPDKIGVGGRFSLGHAFLSPLVLPSP